MMSVTDSIVILFTSPVLTFILGKWFLKEPVERVEFLCAFMSYGGVIFVAKPAFLFPSAALSEHHVPMIATLATLGAAFFQSCAQIAIRMLKPVHFLAITHYFGLFNIGLGLATMAVFRIVSSVSVLHPGILVKPNVSLTERGCVVLSIGRGSCARPSGTLSWSCS